MVTVSILFWSAVRIVYWLSHTPTLYGVLSLILPLMILPLLSSAYAEVNYEGKFENSVLRYQSQSGFFLGRQVLQSILPTTERTSLFRYLYGMPIGEY